MCSVTSDVSSSAGGWRLQHRHRGASRRQVGRLHHLVLSDQLPHVSGGTIQVPVGQTAAVIQVSVMSLQVQTSRPLAPRRPHR